MAEEIKSNEMKAMDEGTLVSGVFVDAQVRRVRATITLNSQAQGKITLCEIPKGYLFLYGALNTSKTLGSSTLAIGDETTADLIMTAATLTDADKPVLFGKNAAVLTPFTETKKLYLTVGAAALPAAGSLVVDMYFAAIA